AATAFLVFHYLSKLLVLKWKLCRPPAFLDWGIRLPVADTTGNFCFGLRPDRCGMLWRTPDAETITVDAVVPLKYVWTSILSRNL
ncbi:MAG: hypothetical protein KDB00_17435, partial [Planctomycetales bacterium]|nr:hypothetical protein [Planctomycetales bacterium]